MNKPALIVLGGFAGAGKTTLAAKLSSAYNYPTFSTDTVNDALRVALQKDFHEVSPMSHEVTWHLIKEQLAMGVSVILDANMCSERTWSKLDELRFNMPAMKVLPIILQCTLETHKARIEERGANNKTHLNLGGDAFEDVLFKYEFIENLQRPDIIRVDANGSPEEVCWLVEELLRKQLA